ncbi:MAG: septum formation initiator family protein [Thiotrichaceae bacterium]|nr:septum formation initiator family protein [Thiotrichaceae bacterium]
MIKKLTILFSILATLLFLRLWFGNGSFPVIMQMEAQLAALTVKGEAMQARNYKLEAEVNGLKESLDAIEARARNDFGMIKRGETFYQVITKEPKLIKPESTNTPSATD